MKSDTPEELQTFLVIDDSKKFSHLYQFQMLIDKNYEKKIYVDSADFASLIFGINDFYVLEKDDSVFNFDLFYNKITMVRSLMYNKHLGQISLLNSHMFEFLEKINPNSAKIKSKLKFKDLAHVRWKLKLLDPSDEEMENKNIMELVPYGKIESEAERRYKLRYLIDQGHPRKRTSYLKNNNIISFDLKKEYDLSEVVNTPLFKELYKQLNIIIEGKTQNNFYDALALCQLQDELDEFHKSLDENNENLALPLFYGNKKLIEAASEVSNVMELQNERGRKPFVFYPPKGGEHLIVQGEDFFLIDALYNYRLGEEKNYAFDDFFNEISEYYAKTNKATNSAIPENYKDVTPEGEKIKDSAERAVHLDFFKQWWENDGVNNLRDSLKLINEFKEDDVENESFEYVDDEFNSIYKKAVLNASQYNLGLKYIKIAFHREFMKSLNSKHNEAGLLQYNLEQEFLTRFSYNLDSIASIKEFISKLHNSYKQNDTETNAELKIEMLTYLQYVVDYSVLQINRTKKNELKLKNLCVMLSILWIEEEYDLLNKFCDAINTTFDKNEKTSDKNYYPNYQIALLHAASLIRSASKIKKEIDYPRIENILNCIERKFDALNYKSWLGQSFIYSKLWESVKSRISIPEILMVAGSNFERENELRAKYFSKCSTLSKKSYSYIIDDDKWDSAKRGERDSRKYYAINLYIYIETLNRPLNEFPGELEHLVKDLEGVANDEIMHERYLDTLARYDQRMAAKVAIEDNNEDKYQGYIKMALTKVNLAIEQGKAMHNNGDLALFHALHHELERMEIEGCDYFKE